MDAIADLPMRFVVGGMFAFFGWGKIHGLYFGETVAKPAQDLIETISKMGLPSPELMAGAVAGVEFLGGLLILLGLGTRFAAMALCGVMAGAAFSQYEGGPQKMAFALVMLGCCIYFSIKGSETMALGPIVRKSMLKKKVKEAQKELKQIDKKK